jgi:hypothetical protein
MSAEDFAGKFAWLKKLFWPVIPGIACLFAGALGERPVLMVAGALLAIPFFVFLYVLTFLHWKQRYVGTSSTLWGVLLAIETSGWFKIVYLFRHILPDMRSSGRYFRR